MSKGRDLHALMPHVQKHPFQLKQVAALKQGETENLLILYIICLNSKAPFPSVCGSSLSFCPSELKAEMCWRKSWSAGDFFDAHASLGELRGKVARTVDRMRVNLSPRAFVLWMTGKAVHALLSACHRSTPLLSCLCTWGGWHPFLSLLPKRGEREARGKRQPRDPPTFKKIIIWKKGIAELCFTLLCFFENFIEKWGPVREECSHTQLRSHVSPTAPSL